LGRRKKERKKGSRQAVAPVLCPEMGQWRMLLSPLKTPRGEENKQV